MRPPAEAVPLLINSFSAVRSPPSVVVVSAGAVATTSSMVPWHTMQDWLNSLWPNRSVSVVGKPLLGPWAEAAVAHRRKTTSNERGSLRTCPSQDRYFFARIGPIKSSGQALQVAAGRGWDA